MVHCAQCGAPVHGPYCGQCGAAVPQAASAAEPTSTAAVGGTPPPGGRPGPDFTGSPLPPPRGGGNSVRNALIAAIVVFALVIGGGLVYIVRTTNHTTQAGGEGAPTVTSTRPVSPTPTQSRTATDPPTTPVTPSTSSEPDPTPGAPSPTPTDEADALHKLNSWADADEARSPLNDKWQVVLGSKYVGIVDTKQQATPFTARDIWSQFQGYRREFSADADKFRVLRSSDYGDQGHLEGQTYFVAMLMFNFDSRAAAHTWCKDRFHKTGKALQEDCIEAKYTAPHH